MGNDPAAVAGRKWVPARQLVYDYVCDGILQGRLAGGTFLEEEEVSAAVGVSRTPVREAFQLLHGERLIDLLPRRGAMVRVVTVQELREVYETRLMIETHAVRRLCAAGQKPPAAMSEALHKLQQLGRDDISAHVRLNSIFHRALVAAAGNGVITELYDSLRLRQERVAMTSVHLDPDRQDIIHSEHAALLAALTTHDSDAAARILSEHLRPIRDIVARLPDSTGNFTGDGQFRAGNEA